MEPTKIEISHKTIIFTVLLLLLLWLLFFIKDILLVIFISTLLMVVLEPLVRPFERAGVPRAIALLLIYAFSLSFLGVAIAGVVPPLVDQTAVLLSRFPEFLEQVGVLGVEKGLIENQISQLGSIPANLFNFLRGFFSNLASIVVLGVVTFYLSVERRNLEGSLVDSLGKPLGKRVIEALDKVETRLGYWLRGELILMTVVGLLSYFGFRLLGIEFALPLAILAGLLEVIPNFGPTIASVPATLAGLLISPLHALGALCWSIVVQQVENNFIVPKVMQKVTGLNPLVVIISLTIGFRLAGIAGATLAVPVILVLGVIFSEVLQKKPQIN